MNLFDQVIATLEDADPMAADEALLDAAFLFEKATLRPAAVHAQSFAASMGWSPEVIAQEVSVPEVRRLREALIQFIRQHLHHPVVGSAVWALSKLHDPSLRTVFEQVLERHLRREPTVLYQALLALRSLGFRIPGDTGTWSIQETERNQQVARSYLARQGKRRLKPLR